MAHTARPRFGIMTAPSQVDYQDVLRVWREADTIPEIEHAWLFDHLMPMSVCRSLELSVALHGRETRCGRFPRRLGC